MQTISRALCLMCCLVWAVSCSEDVPGSKVQTEECSFDSDCEGGAMCSDGVCVLIDGEEDVGVDEPVDIGPRPDMGEDPDSNVGDPCDDGDDCSSGFCIEVAEGEGTRICTDFCDPNNDTCPDGFTCAAVANSGADRIFLCFPETDFLCRACESDSTCGGLSDLCLALADGRFCGRSCETRACPDGFDCVQAEGPAGPTPQCRPTSGVCSDCFDEDGDGYGLGSGCEGIDCDEGDRAVNEGAEELCNGRDDDCDDLVDEGLTTNACGGCAELEDEPETPCGTCGLGQLVCDGPDAVRCEGDPGEEVLNACGGCETLLFDPLTPCGTCNSGEYACEGPESVVCAGDQGDEALNACGGCEVLENPPETACGRCGLDRFVCDGQEATVCNGDTAINGCGGCGNLPNEPQSACGVCGDGRFVCNGREAVLCDDPPPPAETCNLFDDNCNGQIDEGIQGGCKVNVHRSRHSDSGEHFYTTSATEARCCGYVVESLNYYALYRNPAPGLVPFYRCFRDGNHFYTTSSTCELQGPGALEGRMGFIATNELPGTVQLYRAYNGRINDHFYTTSLAEFNEALRNGGYSGEPSAGWVFPVD